jgi:quinol monooxygenase YgiN
MYNLTWSANVTAGRLSDYEDATQRFLEYMSTVAGLISISDIVNLSYPQRHTFGAIFTDRSQAEAWERSPGLTAAIKAYPAGLITPVGETAAWISVASSTRVAQSTGFLLATFGTANVGFGSAQAFEQWCRDYIAVLEREAQGLQSAVLWRRAGSLVEYGLTRVYASVADQQASAARPAIQAVLRENRAAQYLSGPPTSSMGDIVRIAVPRVAVGV